MLGSRASGSVVGHLTGVPPVTLCAADTVPRCRARCRTNRTMIETRPSTHHSPLGPSGCYLFLPWFSSPRSPLPCSPLPSLSLSGLSGPPWLSLRAEPCRLSGGSGDSACRLPEASLPAARLLEPAVREAGGWLPGRLAASADPRPGAATALLVPASCTTSPRTTPMRAPSSAPTTTRRWPRRRNGRSSGPPRSNIPPCVAEAPRAQTSARRQLSLDALRPTGEGAGPCRPGGHQPTQRIQPMQLLQGGP
jgi:hypothetical protein